MRIQGCWRSRIIPPCTTLWSSTIPMEDDQVSPGDWLACLGRGWTEPASRVEALHLPTLMSMLQAAVGGAKPGHSSQSAETKPKSAPAGGGSRVVELVSCNLAPANVARLLKLSPDSCLTLINGSADPMGEWSRLPPAQQQTLSTLLWHSWQGRPLEISNRDAVIPATLSCVWSTTTRAASNAFFQADPFWPISAAVVVISVQGGLPALP